MVSPCMRTRFERKKRIIGIIEDALTYIQNLEEENNIQDAEFLLGRVRKRLESVFSYEEPEMEDIILSDFLHSTCNEVMSLIGKRNLNIIKDFNRDVTLTMDRNVLKKICEGLLKNAIENTPDEGKIEVNLKSGRDFVRIDFRDYGVGITEQNQKMIFWGFFHTQDTNYYSSKKPYAFNAGGVGADLLRTKVFSERYGFLVSFKSARCIHLPKDTDICPGRISACPLIKSEAECYSSGGSLFSLSFSI